MAFDEGLDEGTQAFDDFVQNLMTDFNRKKKVEMDESYKFLDCNPAPMLLKIDEGFERRSKTTGGRVHEFRITACLQNHHGHDDQRHGDRQDHDPAEKAANRVPDDFGRILADRAAQHGQTAQPPGRKGQRQGEHAAKNWMKEDRNGKRAYGAGDQGRNLAEAEAGDHDRQGCQKGDQHRKRRALDGDNEQDRGGEAGSNCDEKSLRHNSELSRFERLGTDRRYGLRPSLAA